MARAIEQLKQAMEVCELGALTLPDQIDSLMDAGKAILQEVSTLTPPNEPERAGLYGKYTVYKNKDGSLVTDCFILRPAKDPAAVVALRAYAAATDNTELAADIINWVGAEPNEPLTYEQLREMDGEPVWVNSIRLWGIVRVYSYGIRVITKSGEFDITRMKIYRRPPEGEEDT